MKAVIFDMDGVISDTQSLHAQAESELLSGYGIKMEPDEITRRFAGVSDKAMYEQIFSECGRAAPIFGELRTGKWRLMKSLADNVRPIPGALELIKKLANDGYGLAVASSSPHFFIDKVMAELKLDKFFSVRISADDVKHGKPAPDIFLAAAARLGVPAEDCFVIEDAASGIRGANRAGMTSIAFNLDSSEAVHKVSKLKDFWKLINLR